MKTNLSRVITVIIEFAVLFVCWLLLSGHYEAKYIITGIVMAGIVTAATHHLLVPGKHEHDKRKNYAKYILLSVWRLFLYMFWLIWAIIKANIQVAAIVINPRLPIDPTLLSFKTGMKKEISLVTLANSITLTPGTITADLYHNTYLVHALVPETAGDLVTGLMQNKIGYVFGEDKDPVPDIRWGHSLNEMK